MSTRTSAPKPSAPTSSVDLPPDPWAYRLKNRLLGRPLHTEELAHERLGKPTALAVFASDNLSSSAYATEEILRVLVPVVGAAAFSLVLPITFAMLAVLALLILSYMQTIRYYPKAAGAYIVAKDNFGNKTALVAGVALLTDYILTVAVSVSAGSAAIASAFPALAPHVILIALSFIALIAYGNLRGMRESGRVFAVPTYFFMFNMALLLGIGMWRLAVGDLPVAPLGAEGMVEAGDQLGALSQFALIFLVLHAFASGGAAVTGVEAISDGVPAFRRPEWRNARQTLLIMGLLLGIMFLGLSLLAATMHVSPYEEGVPTVMSQIGAYVYGSSPPGQLLFFSLQAGTALILILAANTGFADFPRLAFFQASDSFLPRQLLSRGHRLVFSNGIFALAAAAAGLVIVTGASVEGLIPLYAVGVFTSFTVSQSAMTRFHLRERQPGWQRGLVINSLGASVTLVVALVIAVTKFADGAWRILVVLPLLYAVFLRLNRQYEGETAELERDVPQLATARILRRHVVLVLVDLLDVTAARALQYARTLRPDELRAVHVSLDPQRSSELAEDWRRLGLSNVPLQIYECPDRQLAHGVLEIVAEQTGDGETEVTVLIGRRLYRHAWQRFLHDRSADEIVREVSRLPHANVTIVPYHLGSGPVLAKPPPVAAKDVAAARQEHVVEVMPRSIAEVPAPSANGACSICDAGWREKVTVIGKVKWVQVQPLAGNPTLECHIEDETGGISLVFLGRRDLPGVNPGVKIKATGRVGRHHAHRAIFNPDYELLS